MNGELASAKTTLQPCGVRTVTRRDDRRFSFPKYGKWTYKHLSGVDLATNVADRNRIRLAMREAWLDEAPRTTTFSQRYSGYSGYADTQSTSVSVPNFKARSAAGEIFNNPHSKYYTKMKSVVISQTQGSDFDVKSGTISEEWAGNNIIFWYHGWVDTKKYIDFSVPLEVVRYLETQISVADMGQNAVNTAFGNMQQGEVELGAMLLEGRSTIAHLVSVITRLAGLIRAIKNKDISRLAPKTYRKMKDGLYGVSSGTWNLFEDAWMECRYAWIPLISDIQGVINIIGGNVVKRQTYRGKDKSEDYINVDASVTCAGAGVVKLRGLAYQLATSRAGVLAEKCFDAPNLQNIGFFNIATAVKEVIPFSFVLEWLVNLSGLLYTLNPNPLLRPRAAWLTNIAEIRFAGTLEWTPSGGTAMTIPVTAECYRLERSPISEPGLVTIDENLNLSRMIDSVILLLRVLR